MKRWLDRLRHRHHLLGKCLMTGREPTRFLLLDNCEDDEPQCPSEVSVQSNQVVTVNCEQMKTLSVDPLTVEPHPKSEHAQSSLQPLQPNQSCSSESPLKSNPPKDNGKQVPDIDQVRQASHDAMKASDAKVTPQSSQQNRSFDNLLHRVERMQLESRCNKLMRVHSRLNAAGSNVHGSEDNLLHCIPPPPRLPSNNVDQPTHCWPCGCSAEHVRLLKAHQCTKQRKLSSCNSRPVSPLNRRHRLEPPPNQYRPANRAHASADELSAVPEVNQTSRSMATSNRYVNVVLNGIDLARDSIEATMDDASVRPIQGHQLNYSDLHFDPHKSTTEHSLTFECQPNDRRALICTNPFLSSTDFGLSSLTSTLTSSTNGTSSTAAILYAKMDFAAMNSLQKVKSTRAENLRSIDTMAGN
jgi:hypothetical protein